jgi:macrolide transport system ATP-binding/permease protein
MRTLRRFVRRLTAWATSQRDEQRLRAEIEEYLALQSAENMRAGLAPIEARRQAVLKFGAVESMREGYRDQKGRPFMETLTQDTRMALRRLRKAPAFAITAILTLALGIGATTSIFTLVHAVLLKPLAVAKPDELYRLGRQTHCCMWVGYSQDKEWSIVSYELYSTSATIPKALRNWRPFKPAVARFLASGGLTTQRRRGAIREGLCPAITFRCSE